MSENLEEQARKLAAQAYHIVISREEIEQGEYVFFLSYLELPGCIAQGDTLEEAKAELEDVAYEYILGYLQDGVPVPTPYSTSRTTSGAQSNVKNVAVAYPTVERTSWEPDSHVFATIQEE